MATEPEIAATTSKVRSLLWSARSKKAKVGLLAGLVVAAIAASACSGTTAEPDTAIESTPAPVAEAPADVEPQASDLEASELEASELEASEPTAPPVTEAPSVDDVIGDPVFSSGEYSDYVTLAVTNNSSKQSAFTIDVNLLDASGQRVGDDTIYISGLRPGETSIEEYTIFSDAEGIESAEIAKVDRRADESPDDISEVTVEVTGVDFVGDIEVKFVATNSSSKTSDYYVEAALINADGIRIGTASGLINNVPPGGSAPDEGYTLINWVDDVTAEVFAVSRTATPDTEASSSDDVIGDPVFSSGEYSDYVTLAVTNNSSKQSQFTIDVNLLDASGERVDDDTIYISNLRPGETSIEKHTIFSNAEGIESAEIAKVDRRAEESPDDISEVTVEVTGVDFVGDIEVKFVATNSSSRTSDYSVEAALINADGIRIGTASGSISNVPPGESAPDDGYSTAEWVDGVTAEVISVRQRMIS